MKVLRTTEMLHPVLIDCVDKIQKEVINQYNIPMRLFETGRMHDRHEMLLKKGKTQELMSRHLFKLENDPPLYATAIDYVYYVDRWSWNLRNSTISSWYILFGNLVLDACPELEWGGQNRKNTNYCHFQLSDEVIYENYDKIKCVLHKNN